MMRRVLMLIWLSVAVYGAYAQSPTVPSQNIQFSDVFCNRVTVSWTSGNGVGRILIAKEGSAVTVMPGTDYEIASDTFGKGFAEIGSAGSKEYVVYNGTGNSTIVYGLKANTTYHFTVVEYNGSGSSYAYNTSSVASKSITTEWLTADFTMASYYQCYLNNNFQFYEDVTQSGSNTISYNWNFGDNKTSQLADPTHTYASYGRYKVTLTATSLGCKDSKSIEDTVAPMPIMDFVLFVDTPDNDQVQCFYNQNGKTNRFYFKNTTVNPSLGTGWDLADIDWDFGDGTSSNQYNGRKSYKKPGTYVVTLIVSAKKNLNSPRCIDSTKMTVTVKPRPIIADSVYFSDTVLCYDNHVFVFENNSGVAGTNSWFFGDGVSAIGAKTSHSYANPKTKKYQVKLEVVDAEGCYDEYSDSVRVIAQPNNYYVGLDSNYCQYDTKSSLTPNILGGKFFGDVVISTSSFDPVKLGKNTIGYIVNVDGCTDSFVRQTTVLERPEFDLGKDTTICTGTSFDITVDPGTGTILWSTGSPNSTETLDTETIYWAEVNNGQCLFRDSLDVNIISPPVVDLGNDSILCGGSVRYVNVKADDAQYFWSDGYPDPDRTLDETGTYKVVVINKCGADSADVDLTVLPFACDIYVPNAFSPNGDGINPVFRPIGNVTVTQMMIFNRWGELLYISNDTKPEWDGVYKGKVVQPGYYMYIINYNKPTGEYFKPETISGEVIVVY